MRAVADGWPQTDRLLSALGAVVLQQSKIIVATTTTDKKNAGHLRNLSRRLRLHEFPGPSSERQQPQMASVSDLKAFFS